MQVSQEVTNRPTASGIDDLLPPDTPPTSRPPGQGFASNVLKLITGSTCAQVLTVATAPLIARLFAPAAFGTAAVFLSITGLISAVVGMRYELSIVLPERDEDAANCMALSFFFVCLTSTATAILLFFSAPALLHLFRAPELLPYMPLVSVTVFVNGIFAILSYWHTRNKTFGVLTIAQFASVMFFVAAQIIAGYAGYTSGGTMIVLTLLSTAVGTFTLTVTTAWHHLRLFRQSIAVVPILNVLKRYSGFPKYSTASAVLNNLGWQVPTFFLSAFFSSTVVGHYALGNKILRLPVSLLGANIATVFFQHASEANHRGTLQQSVDRLFQYLTNIFMFPSLLLCFIGRDLFATVFGERWAEAGVYTEIMSIYVLFWFMAVPLGITLNVMEKQALELRLIIAVLVARLLALWVGGEMGSARIALALFSVAGVVVYGYFCFVVLRHCELPIARIADVLGRGLAMFAPAGIVIGVMKYVKAPAELTLLVAGLSLALYYAHLIRIDETARQLVTGYVHRFSATPSGSGR